MVGGGAGDVNLKTASAAIQRLVRACGPAAGRGYAGEIIGKGFAAAVTLARRHPQAGTRPLRWARVRGDRAAGNEFPSPIAMGEAEYPPGAGHPLGVAWWRMRAGRRS